MFGALSGAAADVTPPRSACDTCRTPQTAPAQVRRSAGSVGSVERSPQLERHHVRFTSVEPVSPSLARWPDGTPLKAERTPHPPPPPPRRVSLGARRELFPAVGGETVTSTATPPAPPRRTVSLAVPTFAGAPRWAQRPRPCAARLAEPVRTDPQRKLSSQYDEHIHQMRG